MRDNVSKVLSIFSKLIVRLEKIIENERVLAQKEQDKILECTRKRDAHAMEIAEAERAITKFNKFLE